MSIDAAEASSVQVFLLAACYVLAGAGCAMIGALGTPSWTTRGSRLAGVICGVVAGCYGIYLAALAIIGSGFIPLAWLGLIVPVGMTLNSQRYRWGR